MRKELINKAEIDMLYKKIGINSQNNKRVSTSFNTGTLNNKLASQFNGARPLSQMKRPPIKSY